MLNDNHLTLRLVRLKAAEKWQFSAAGLCFLFVRGGSGRYVTETVNQRLGQGDVLVFNGLEDGKISAADTAELAFSFFSGNVEHLFPLFSVNEVSLLQNVIDRFKVTKLQPAGSPLAVECHRLIGIVPPQFNLDHRSHLLRVVAVVLNEEFKSLQLQRRPSGFVSMEEHLLQVFEKLSANDLLNLSAGELAEKFGCSRRHLNRLFHQHFGFSVAALKMEMRMLKAVSLLRESAAKVINVAEQCGFNHLGLFNTCFKRRFGASPGQWRTMAAQVPAPAAANGGDRSPCPLESNGLCPMLGGLGGASVSNPSGAWKSQLRSAALSTVLARPAPSNNSNQKQASRPARLNGRPEPDGHTAFQSDA
jgi:AraC-like DNA-binding protein